MAENERQRKKMSRHFSDRINGKRYIGITNNTPKRWYGKGKHYDGCPYFFAAIQKYGWDNFDYLEA